MKNLNYLFICSSDLADVDVNGRTVRDTFSFIDDKNLFCISQTRLNPNLKNDQVFAVSDSDIYKLSFFKNFYDKDVQSLQKFKNEIVKKHSKKTPFLCLLRTLMWKISFVFWKNTLYKWVKSKNIDILVYNCGDFSFNNYLVYKLVKKFKLNLIMYNTEFYYFKDWNYLRKQNLIYRIFIGKFRRSFDKIMKLTKLCIYNIHELAELYKKKFPNITHQAFLHTSTITQNISNKKTLPNFPLFYYSGSLDKRRHVPLFALSNQLSTIFPESKILVHGNLGTAITNDDLSNHKNIVYEGLRPYSEIVEHLMSNNLILLSLSPIDEYASKNNYYGFSTKLADCISSLNPILHIGSKTVETECLIKNNLAYVAYNENEISGVLYKIKSDIDAKKLRFVESQKNFCDKYLNQKENSKQLYNLIIDTFHYQ